MRGLRPLVLASLLGLAVPSVAAEQVFAVEYDDARLYVPVRAGAKDLGAWVLDTGVQRSIVDDGLAATLGLRTGATEEVSGAGRGTMRHIGHRAARAAGALRTRFDTREPGDAVRG